WERTDLWQHAVRIPGVTVQADPAAAMARVFAVQTSGAVLVYSPDGRLRFAGGITGSRGHEGGNAGTIAVSALVSGCESCTSATPVYGCGLFGEAKESRQ